MGCRILVLEDDEGIRGAMHLILELEEYEIMSYNLVASFAAREVDQQDLFILDVMLPDGNRLAVCSDLKEKDNNIPVSIMSAHASLGDVEAACAADGFIEKPFDIDQMLDKVRKLLKLSD
ncbi:MAG: response regulator [Pedobacter sp.]|nr:MAG: response regulator [Pedobacter sp.]